MKGFGVKETRTVALIGHSNVGKTSILDAMMFNAKANDRLGSVDNGSSIADTDAEEKKRHITITAKPLNCEWKKHNLFVIDTPGYMDFFGEVAGNVWVSDSVVLIVDAVSGVEVGTIKTWEAAENAKKPRMLFVNKMDKENANFYETLESIQESFGTKCVPVQLPVGKQNDFKAVVDILSGDASALDAEGKAYLDANKDSLIETIAETDDTLVEKYLEGEQLSSEELNAGLLKGIMTGEIFPVLSGSADRNIGINELMDAICTILPCPADTAASIPVAEGEVKPDPSAPFSALVFKTVTDPYVGQLTYFRIYSGSLKADSEVLNVDSDTKEKIGHLYIQKGKEQLDVSEAGPGDIVAVAKLKKTHLGETLTDGAKVKFNFVKLPNPVLSYAVTPKSRGDEEKMSTGLSRINAEDQTLKIERNAETKELVISGMGDVHLEIAFNKLREKFGVDVETKEPKIPYKETITASAEGHEKHKKQSGGKGQYGECFIRIHPMERGAGFEFVDQIVGGVIPKGYIPAIEKGIVTKMEEGILAGNQVVDLKVELYFGSYHTVDSSEMAFKIAGSKALQDAFGKAKPVLLEPIMDVEIVVGGDYTGDISGDINHKRGRIMGIEPKGKMQVVKAQVPLAEMGKYANELRSITQGQGTFSMEFSRYEQVPGNIAEKVIAESKKEEE